MANPSDSASVSETGPAVLCAGVAVMDFVFSLDAMPRVAEKYRARDAWITGGGNAANAAVAVARLGGTASLAARTGADTIGNMILLDLQQEGVNTSLVNCAKTGKSSFSSIYIDADGERQIMNFRGAGLSDNADWLIAPQVCHAVLADNRWGPLTVRALAIARDLNIPGIVDVEAPLDAACLQGATHLAFSKQGLNAYADNSSQTLALQMAHEQFGAWVCVTDGENGVEWFDGEQSGHVPAVTIEAVETLGAGDVWHAAFALKMAERKSEVEAIRFANAAGALKCIASGGRQTYPDHQAVDQFLQQQPQ